ncbi:MAG: 30S ribosomal protein S9 [Actinomycetales bacterium]|nr:30S ribosomal protein S9 [Actinomycetales bacterium]
MTEGSTPVTARGSGAARETGSVRGSGSARSAGPPRGSGPGRSSGSRPPGSRSGGRVETPSAVGDEDAATVDPTEVGDSVLVASSRTLPAGEPVPGVIGRSGGTGRRKEAVARVRIIPGTGRFLINGRVLDAYFPNRVHQQVVREPFRALNLGGTFDVFASISGGGVSGQAGALRLGIARALNELDREAYRGHLKRAGYLTRDARAKERKKAGLKKARKAPQYSKR